VNEHEFEPIKGLPETLPQGEYILWQGRPAWWPLALRALHVRLALGYCAFLMVWSIAADLYAGVGLGATLLTASKIIPIAVVVGGFLTLYAWLVQRSTVYTVTNKRVVMRYGVALPMTLNLPYAVIESAALKTYRDGTGDIPLTLTQEERVSYFLLWPNVRPWRAAKPQPMLRAIPNAKIVARSLSEALAGAAKQRGVQGAKIEYSIANDAANTQQEPAPA
jgi:Bacterial PH domain